MQDLWIALHLTDRCQLDCLHCLRDPALEPIDLDLSAVVQVLDQAKSVYKIGAVGLTGGEPTLHPRFIDVVDAIVDRDMCWHLVTNGFRFNHLAPLLEKRPARLEKLSVVDLSIEGATEEIHDKIRGAGSYRKVLRAATLCQAMGIDFVLQTTINAINAHEIEDVALLASHLGAKGQVFGMTQATGTGSDEELYLPLSKWRQIRDRIDQLAGAMRINVEATALVFHDKPFFVCQPFQGRVLHVDNMGRLTLCCQLSGIPGEGERTDVLGDLREMTLAEGHRRMLRQIQGLQEKRVTAIEQGTLGAWDASPCNWCLKVHDRPHWVENGVNGPAAARQRRRKRDPSPTERKRATGDEGDQDVVD